MNRTDKRNNTAYYSERFIVFLIRLNLFLPFFIQIDFYWSRPSHNFVSLINIRENKMTEDQKGLVKNSWKVFRSIDPLLVGEVFYGKLFSEWPELRHMFPTEMERQYIKLTDMLGIIVARLDRLEELSQEILALAQRHAGYGAKPEHYKMVGEALIWTLQQGFGKDWTPALREAWLICYTILCDLMIKGSMKIQTI